MGGNLGFDSPFKGNLKEEAHSVLNSSKRKSPLRGLKALLGERLVFRKVGSHHVFHFLFKGSIKDGSHHVVHSLVKQTSRRNPLKSFGGSHSFILRPL